MGQPTSLQSVGQAEVSSDVFLAIAHGQQGPSTSVVHPGRLKVTG